jgi:hypothetical protein
MKGAGWQSGGYWVRSNNGDLGLVLFLRQVVILLDIGLLDQAAYEF